MPRPQDQYDALVERLPIGRDPASVRRRIEAMEKLLERMFTFPGTNRQFGLDVVFDLIPVGGSLIAAAVNGSRIRGSRCHCERSEAIQHARSAHNKTQLLGRVQTGLLRRFAPRNDDGCRLS